MGVRCVVDLLEDLRQVSSIHALRFVVAGF